jgi:glycosyltransferase involved in cell wall biosynthesis
MRTPMNNIINSCNTVVINATNIGLQLNGIGTYTLNIIKELAKLETNINFIIYLNRSCKVYLDKLSFPDNFSLKWVTGWTSPDKKFFGHLLRLVYSNYLAIKHPLFLQFNTSPLEICFFKSNQIVMVHDIIPLLFKQYHKKQYLFFKYLKYILQNVRMIITPSYYTKKLLIENYQLSDEDIQVSHLGITREYFINPSKAENVSPYILYIGRINKMKNIESIIKAYVIASESQNINLIVIGDNQNEFFNFIDQFNSSDKVREKIIFMQNVNHEEKIRLIKNASLFLYPTQFEGFGLPPIEAMDLGCPVIVSNNSSMPEVCGNAAFYVNASDVNEIAVGISEVLTNANLRDQLIQNGYENVKRYSWEKTALEHFAIMKRILNPVTSDSEEVTKSLFEAEIRGDAI